MAARQGDDRRAAPGRFRVAGGLRVDVVVPIGKEPVVLGATVVELNGPTLVLAMDDGAAALAVAASRWSVIAWAEDGEERCAVVRAGRRVDDVHSPTVIELVLEELDPALS